MKSILIHITCVFTWIYYSLLFAWFFAYLLIGDSFPYLGVLNLIAVYFFLPLPVGFLAALLSRKPSLWLTFSAALLVFLLLWGQLFLPSPPPQPESHPQLTVMTYNVLAWHDETDAVIDAILAADADLVYIQELNTSLAAALESQLSSLYPYQVLSPQDNPRGIGTISRYPLDTADWEPAVEWISPPQVFDMIWYGRTVRVVNFHMHPTARVASYTALTREFRRREAQAHELVRLSRTGYPTVLGGDANAAPLNEAYKILASEYQDAWRQAGSGLGHTFPTPYIAPGLERNQLGGIEIPPWVVRIDYIFYSPQWDASSAWFAPPDGVSDHRGILASLFIKD